MMKLDLSVIILTKNEELHIERAVRSVSNFAQKIVIVDSYSEDNTKEICKKLSEEFNIDFFEREFVNHYDQFNWAIDNNLIETNWIMRLDADEYVTDDLSNELIKKLEILDNDITGITINRRIVFLGKWIKHGGIYPLKILRIFRRGMGYCEHKDMDEHLVVRSGKIVEFEHDIIDHNLNNLTWWINKHNWYSNKEVNAYLTSKKNLNKNMGNQTGRKRWIKENLYYQLPYFVRSYLFFIYRFWFRLGFLDGKEGFLFHFLQGYWYRLLVDAKILEKEKNK